MHVPSTLQLYFQQIRPLAKCDAEDGRVVAHLLMDLVHGKPKELPPAIRDFANCTAMLRECGFSHVGEMLVAMLVPNAHANSEHVPKEDAAGDPAFATAEQATALGGMLAAGAHSSQAPAMALQQVIDLHSILRTMKTRHAWFVPMLEVLLALPEAANSRRPTIARRLTATVTALSMVHDPPSNASFDSVVRSAGDRIPLRFHSRAEHLPLANAQAPALATGSAVPTDTEVPAPAILIARLHAKRRSTPAGQNRTLR
jgi:hypothetical protein